MIATHRHKANVTLPCQHNEAIAPADKANVSLTRSTQRDDRSLSQANISLTCHTQRDARSPTHTKRMHRCPRDPTCASWECAARQPHIYSRCARVSPQGVVAAEAAKAMRRACRSSPKPPPHPSTARGADEVVQQPLARGERRALVLEGGRGAAAQAGSMLRRRDRARQGVPDLEFLIYDFRLKLINAFNTLIKSAIVSLGGEASKTLNPKP